jgi:hypothetical protein
MMKMRRVCNIKGTANCDEDSHIADKARVRKTGKFHGYLKKY